MFLTSQHIHWDKDCNNYTLVSSLVERKLRLCYGVPTAQELWVLAIPGTSLQMAWGLQGGQRTLSVSGRGRNMTGTLLSTHRRCKIQSAEDHWASIWLWEPQLTLQGEKLCPQSFTCIITRMVNRLNIHCEALDFSIRFLRGRESKQQFTLICRWAQLRGKRS